MFETKVSLEFSAAHHIPNYPGDCARVHGHNWVMEVTTQASELNEIGLSIDFKDIKRSAKKLIDRWDHQNLNELEEFRTLAPTAENVAQFTYRFLSSEINSDRVRVVRVSILENQRCSATYFE